MIRKAAVAIGLVVLLTVAYLLGAPIPVQPRAWQAPVDAGFTGPFLANERMVGMQTLTLAGRHGPEDMVARGVGDDVVLYTSSKEGDILAINPRTEAVTAFAKTGGLPLGMELGPDGTLYVADSHRGLLAISQLGEVTVLVDQLDGAPLLFVDDLDIGPNGVIYFTDASQRFGPQAVGSPMAASELDIIEQHRTGRVLAFDPRTGMTRVITDGLSFANGIAVSADGRSLLVAETGQYRVFEISVAGPSAGARAVVFDNLPGFPDNINRGPDLPDGTATYLLGLAGPRVAIVDQLAARPWLRRALMRLPVWLKPEPERYGFVMQFTAQGEVLQTWQDPGGGFATTTGALVPGDGYVYFTSVEEDRVGRLVFSTE